MPMNEPMQNKRKYKLTTLKEDKHDLYRPKFAPRGELLA